MTKMALAITTHDSELDALRRRLAARLHALRGQVRFRLWLDVASRLVVAVAALGIVSFTLDWWLELSLAARIAYIVLAGALVAWATVKSVLAVLRLRLEPIELAAELDKVRQSPPAQWIAPRVATVLQLSDLRTREAGFSAPMVDRAVRHSSEALEGIDFSRRLDERQLRQCVVLLVAALAAPLLFAALIPGEFSSLWARRWLLGSNVGWPRDTAIDVLGLSDGRLIVPRGEPASVRVAVHDRRGPTELVWVRITAPDAAPETATMVKFATGDFRFELPPQQQTVAADFWGGDGRVGPIEIVPVDRPRIARLSLVYQHPRDKTPHTYSFTGEEGNIRLLKQTAAELTLAANVAVSTLDVSADGPATGGAPTAPKFERIDERTFRAKWIHQGPLQMKVGMVARDSQLASRPEPVAIGFQEDRPPRVTLTHSGVGARVTPSAIIPLKVAVRDDFAVARAALAFKVVPNVAGGDRPEGERPKVANPPSMVLYQGKPPLEPTFDAAHEWDLESLKLGPGDTVSATAEAADDCYTGAQTSNSRTLAFRIVSRTELFREILLKQQQLRARLRKATEQAELLRQSLRSASLTDDADELLRRHNLIQREVWQVMHGIEDSATEMRLNRLGGAETHEIIVRTVIAPLERLHDDLLTRQRQGLESVRQSAAETQEQLAGRQQEIVDAMSKVLKSMSQWDSFIDVVNQLTEVINLENLVRNKTEELKKKQFDSIFDSK
jgi:hypothetical protein